MVARLNTARRAARKSAPPLVQPALTSPGQGL